MANNIHVQKLLAALLLLCGPCRSAKPKSVTIWMVLDGFRSDYWDKYDIPHLKSLANQGVRVVDVKPVFPSSWVPNVASMVTGEYSNKHNIVDQDMFDRETETQFNMSMPMFWEDVVKIGSIWDNYAKSGVNRHVKILGLPESKLIYDPNPAPPISAPPTTEKESASNSSSTAGEGEEGKREEEEETEESEAGEKGTAPAAGGGGGQKQAEAPKSKPSNAELFQALGLRDGEDGGNQWPSILYSKVTQILEEEYDLPNHELFLTVFIGEPGTSAQALGPDGVDAALSLVDSFVGGLQSYLDETRMSEVTNLLVTSTPGYLPVSADRVLGLKRNINADFKKTGNSPIYQFEANGSGDEALQLVQQLQEFEEKSKACTTFINTREEDRWHYREGKNVLSIYLVAKPGWVFEDDFIPKIKKWNRDFDRPYNRDNLYGCAGYDNSVAETHPMLIGKGPAFTNEGNVFVSNSSLVVSAVDVYPLLTHVLDMRLAKDRAGRIDSLVQILANHPKGHDVKETIENLVEYVKDPEHLPLEVSLILATCVLFISIFCICFARRRHKRQMLEHGFRYSQVRNNRRLEDPDEQWIDEDDDSDDKRGLLLAPRGDGPASAAAGAPPPPPPPVPGPGEAAQITTEEA